MRKSRAVWPLLTAAVVLCGWTLLSALTGPDVGRTNDIWDVSADADDYMEGEGDITNWRGLTDEQVAQLSELGKLLFVDSSRRPPPQRRNFTILVWRHGERLERRHLRRFGDHLYSPWEGCPVSNCKLTYADADLAVADAVIFHLHLTDSPLQLPTRGPEHVHQRWVFLSDESPPHTFYRPRDKTMRLSNFDGLFNWTMTYRMASDVPVPYGRTVALQAGELPPQPTVPHGRPLLAAVMLSNCHNSGNERWAYISRLKELLPGLDVFGHCGTLRCPGHFDKDCPALSQYKFYLSFENTNCREYITEKLWWNAYQHGAVPVVMGASQQEYRRLLPPGSYLHAADFASLEDLARYLRHLDRSPRDYAAYFRWRRRFRVLNEHGYFGSPVYHYCRLCEALNYNDPAPKVYHHLEDFWNPDRDCYPPYFGT